jgi:CheY-like chemotaxis protein/PAS domain-containing protein
MNWRVPEGEAKRVESLKKYHLPHGADDEILNELTWLGAHICGTPIAVVGVVDDTREWFVSRHGLTFSDVAREDSFSAYVVVQADITVIPDVFEHPEFARSRLATLNGIRSYTGFPLISDGGYVLGTLSVMDYVPRALTRDQLEAMKVVARRIASHLFVQGSAHGSSFKVATERKLPALLQQLPAVVWTTNLDLEIVSVGGAAIGELGWDEAGATGQTVFQQFGTTDRYATPVFAHFRAIAGEPTGFCHLVGDRCFRIHVTGLKDETGRLTGCIGIAMLDSEHITVADSEQVGLANRKNRQAPLEEPSKPGEMHSPAGTILLVEDDESLRRLLYVSLAREGFKIVTAVNGAHAIRVCESFSDTIHLVVSDIVMPEMNGLELRSRLASVRPDLKVLLMSAYSEEELNHPGLRLEGIGFLQKPFLLNDLVNTVRGLLSAEVAV